VTVSREEPVEKYWARMPAASSAREPPASPPSDTRHRAIWGSSYGAKHTNRALVLTAWAWVSAVPVLQPTSTGRGSNHLAMVAVLDRSYIPCFTACTWAGSRSMVSLGGWL